jgi:hypothetical protein
VQKGPGQNEKLHKFFGHPGKLLKALAIGYGQIVEESQPSSMINGQLAS